MNFKNAVRIGYAAAVCGALLLPAVLMPFLRSDAGAENRTLAEKPALKTEDGSLNRDFFTDAEAWFSDHFALRGQLVTGYGRLTKSLFATSAEPSVIVGKDGWLYYTDTLPDILGEQRLTGAELEHIVRTLELMQNYCVKYGTGFVFACAPNKAEIYPEYLPARILPVSGGNTLSALKEELSGSGVKSCDLQKVLLNEAKQAEFPVYHKLDTHWNGDGAMTAYQALMRTAGLDDRGFDEYPRTVAHDFEGDLQKMFRDSFGRALIPLLSQRFASCTYSRAEEMPLDLIAEQPTDTVICEIVERNLPDLLLHAPRMAAPAAEPRTAAVRRDGTAPLVSACRRTGSYVHIYGYFDEQFSDSSAVYCTVTLPDGSQQSYEAFPCFEQELLGAERFGANGFSVYLPAEAVPDGAAAEISAVCGTVRYAAGTADLTAASGEETATG